MKRWDTYVCPYRPSQGIICNPPVWDKIKELKQRRGWSQRKRQQSLRFRLAQQQLRTCSTHFSLLTLSYYDVKMPNSVHVLWRTWSQDNDFLYLLFLFFFLFWGWWCWWWLGSLSNNDSDGYDRKKWTRAASNFIALIPSRWICRMLAIFFYSWILKDCIKVNCTAILFETSSWYAVVCSSPCKGKITFVAVYHFKVDQGLLVIYSYTCKSTLCHACFDFIAGFSDPSVCQRESW